MYKKREVSDEGKRGKERGKTYDTHGKQRKGKIRREWKVE